MLCRFFSFLEPGLQTAYAGETGNITICLSTKSQQRMIKWERKRGRNLQTAGNFRIEVFRGLVDILLFRSSWMCCIANLKVAKSVCHCFSTLTNVPCSSKAKAPNFIYLCTTKSSSLWFQWSHPTLSPADRLTGQSQKSWNTFHAHS